MIKVLFNMVRYDAALFFDCDGHSSYKNPDTGNNDLCVATSTLCTMLIKYLGAEFGVAPSVCKDGHVRFDIKEPNRHMLEVFRAVMHEFYWLEEMYPDNLKVY